MQVLQPQVINLNSIVEEMGKLLPRLIGEDIELAIRTANDLGRIRADASQMEQVMMNLAVNARDAMPNGGKLLIETRNLDLDQSYTWSHPLMKPGSYVQLLVTDSGTGMDADTQAHIFEPFFTTKEKGKGTGLGTCDGVRNRQTEWRIHLGLQRVEQRYFVQNLFATSGSARGALHHAACR